MIDLFDYNYFEYNQALAMNPAKGENQNSVFSLSENAILSQCLSKNTNITEESQKIEVTNEMKEIIKKVRVNSTKRMKKYKEQHLQSSKYYQQIEQIVKAVKVKKKSALNEDSTEQEIDRMIWMKRMEIQIMIANNQHKRKKILSLISKIQHLTEQKIILEQSPVKINKQKKKLEQQLIQYKELKQRNEQLQQKKLCLEENLAKQQSQGQLIRKKNQYFVQETTLKINKISELRKIISKLQLQFDTIIEKQIQISKIKVPNENQMIHCTFLVGILKQQTFIHSFLKKEKSNEKSQQDEIIKQARIYQAFTQRTISINYQKSQISHLNVITSIYMHCHSLMVNNLVLKMKALPFFSEQFKTIYNYNIFQRYILIINEKLKMNKEWQKMKFEVANQTKQMQACEKPLIIDVDNHHVSILVGILQIFQIDDCFYLNMGTKKIKIKLNIIQGYQQQQDKNDKAYQLHLVFDV